MDADKLKFREDLIWLCFLDYIETFEQAGILKKSEIPTDLKENNTLKNKNL
jgi:hypothetical protein